MLNVDGDAKGKMGPVGTGGTLRNDREEILCMFSKGVRVKDSNEVEVLAILEAWRIYLRSFQSGLIVESDSFNAILRVINKRLKPWRLQFYLNKIKELASSFGVVSLM